MAQMLGLDDERDLMTLPIGVCYVRSEGFNRAYKVKIPLVEKPPALNDRQVEDLMKPEMDWFFSHSEFYVEEKPIVVSSDVEKEDQDISISKEITKSNTIEDIKAFLQEILINQEIIGVTNLYKSLNLSAGKGNRIKQMLESHRLIISARTKSNSGGRPKEIIQLTELGRKFLCQT